MTGSRRNRISSVSVLGSGEHLCRIPGKDYTLNWIFPFGEMQNPVLRCGYQGFVQENHDLSRSCTGRSIFIRVVYRQVGNYQDSVLLSPTILTMLWNDLFILIVVP